MPCHQLVVVVDIFPLLDIWINMDNLCLYSTLAKAAEVMWEKASTLASYF